MSTSKLLVKSPSFSAKLYKWYHIFQINLGNHFLLDFSNIRRVLLSITKMSDVTCLFFEGDKKTFLSVEDIFHLSILLGAYSK